MKCNTRRCREFICFILVSAFFMPLSAVSLSAIPELSSIEASQEYSVVDTATINRWNTKARQLIEKGEAEKARRYLGRAYRSADSMHYEEGMAAAIVNRGDYYLSGGRYDSAESILMQGYERFKHTSRQIALGNLLATAYRFNGELSRSLSLYNELLQKAEESGRADAAARLQLNLAAVYEKMGDQAQALERYASSLQWAESRSDTSRMAIILNNLGNLNNKMQHYQQAEQHLQEAVKLSKKGQLEVNLARSYLNLGNTYKALDQYELARSSYSKSLQISNQIGSQARPVRITYNLGDVYLKEGKLDSALNNYQRTLDLSKERGIAAGLFYGNFGLGRARAAMKDYTQAHEHLAEALNFAENMGVSEMRTTALKELYQVTSQSDQYKEAYNYLLAYQKLSDSLSSAEQQREIARYRTQFDLRQEQQRNQLLEDKLQARQQTLMVGGVGLVGIIVILAILLWMYQKKQTANRQLDRLNRKMSEQKAKLEQSNQTKNKLLSVLAHDLRNPVSNIQQVASMIRHDILSRDDIEEIARRSETQLQQSLNTLDNLLVWAREQTDGITPTVISIDVESNVDELLTSLKPQAERKKVTLINRINNNLSVESDKEMLNIILRNLAVNAIKYGDNGDRVEIDAERQNGEVVLWVKDNGQGIPADIQDNLFQAFTHSSKGTEGESGVGLGLSLCKEFSEKLNGRIWFESTEGMGSTFFLSLPAKLTN